MEHSRSAGGKTWCDQCERMVMPTEGAACTKAFCKGPKPIEEVPQPALGFPPQPSIPDLVAPKAVDVDPGIVKRIKRERSGPPLGDRRFREYRQPKPEPEENMPESTRPGLTRKQTQLLELMEGRAEEGLVKASYSDMCVPLGTSPTAVMSLIKALTRENYVEIISRPGGRGKTTYKLLAREADEAPVKQGEHTFITAASQKCANCQFCKALTIGHMVCRRLPPSHTVGHPKINPNDWCGEWRLR